MALLASDSDLNQIAILTNVIFLGPSVEVRDS